MEDSCLISNLKNIYQKLTCKPSMKDFKTVKLKFKVYSHALLPDQGSIQLFNTCSGAGVLRDTQENIVNYLQQNIYYLKRCENLD